MSNNSFASLKTTSDPAIDRFFLQHLELPRPISWQDIFGRQAPLVVEIGFGDGEYLIASAKKNPGKDFIGIEISGGLIRKTLKRIAAQKLSNVRLLKIHATIALEYLFEKNSLAEIYALFPFPWPKKRHYRHRLFNTKFLRLANNRLKLGGTFMVTTDYKPYFDWILKQNKDTGFQLKKHHIKPQFHTRFERKWKEEGQKKFFQLVFIKKTHKRILAKKEYVLGPLSCEAFDPKACKPKSITGPKSIIFKYFDIDAKRKTAKVGILTAEENLTQRFSVLIKKEGPRWEMRVNEQDGILRTATVKKALEEILKACRKIRS